MEIVERILKAEKNITRLLQLLCDKSQVYRQIRIF